MLEYEIATRKITGSDGITRDFKYKVLSSDGTWYNFDTPDRVIQILQDARYNNTRLRLFLGDNITGCDWEEIFDVYGYVERTWGRIQQTILLHNSRSTGGGTILTECIVKIQLAKGKQTLYEHPNYHRKPENLHLKIV